MKELCSPEDCDRSGGGRWALERPLRLGLGLRDKLKGVIFGLGGGDWVACVCV